MCCRRVARGGYFVLTLVRWWFSLTYLAGAVFGLIYGLTVLATGDSGEGAFLLTAFPVFAVLGWLIHPWGLQRRLATRTHVSGRQSTGSATL